MFDPKPYIIRINGGQEYLPVAARAEWFRHENPKGCIEAIILKDEEGVAKVQARISDNDGVLLAVAHAVRTEKDARNNQGRYVEIAETAAVGRALASAGYGTLQAGRDLDEGLQSGDVVDAPQGDPVHWLDEGNTRQKFWVYAKNDLGLSEDDVYAALGVDSVHDVPTKAEAVARLKAYAEQTAPPAEFDPEKTRTFVELGKALGMSHHDAMAFARNQGIPDLDIPRLLDVDEYDRLIEAYNQQ